MSKRDLDERFEGMDLSSLTLEEKVSKYFSMYSGCEDWIEPDKVYEWYVEAGKIIDTGEFKKGIFRDIFINDEKKLDVKISSIKYRKVGDYYQIDKPGWYEYFDESGNLFKEESLYFDAFEEEKIEDDSDIQLLQSYLPKEKINVLSEQIKEALLSLKMKYPTNIPEERYFLSVFGNVLKINRFYTNKDSITTYYKIQLDGTLEEVEIRRREKIYR